MALIESVIGGIAGTVIETAIKTGGAVAGQIKGAYTETQAKQKALEAAQNYVQRYEANQCQVKVMPGLMKEPLPLEDIYTAVKLLDDKSIRYFAAVDDLEAAYRAKGRRSFGSSESPRQDGIQVANAEQYLMVLGGPGIGKSTFLRKIGLEALRKNGQIQRDCIPVLIELKELRDEAVDLKQKIAAEFATCGFPEAEAFTEASLAQGKLLVLLDGLDEVPTQNLNRVVEHIEKFVDAHSSNAFVASCRIAAYRGSHGTFFKRFTDVTLAEFDDEQIEQFIRRWFRSELDLESGTADKYWQLLQKDENKATKELAQTPLLLTFLCLIYDRQQILPTQRSTLYGQALDILLSEWSAQKRLEQDPIYEGFHPGLEKVLLAQIAYESFEQDQLFFLKDDITRRIGEFLADTLDAPKHLDGAAVLRAIERQQGILVERATDIYSFSHLTLQEYLTAFHIKEEGLEAELIAQHLTDERWREVFLLVAGLMGNKAIHFLVAIEAAAQIHIKKHQKLLEVMRWTDENTGNSPEKLSTLFERLVALTLFRTTFGGIDSIDSIKRIIKGSDIEVFKAISMAIATNQIAQSALDIAMHINRGSALEIFNIIACFMCISSAVASSANIIITNTLDEHDIDNIKIMDYSYGMDGAAGGTFFMRNEKVVKIEIFFARNISDVEKGILINELNKANRCSIISKHGQRDSVSYVALSASNEIFVDHKFLKLAKQFKSFLEENLVNENSIKDREKRVDEIEALWLNTLDLSRADVTFDVAEIQSLESYLCAMELLLKCKDSAIRVPKQAWAELEDRLLTYPS